MAYETEMMDPLLHFGDYAFIPYLDSASRSGFKNSDPQDLITIPGPQSTTTSISTTSEHPPLSLLNSSTWTYCGPVLAPDASSLPSSFHTWSRATISGPLLPRLIPFLHFLDRFLKEKGVDCYWLTIRAMKKTDEYDVVRWHTDDIFFDVEGEQNRTNTPTIVPDKHQKSRASVREKIRDLSPRRKKKEYAKADKCKYWKLATTLLGPSTLFLQDGDRAREGLRAAKLAEQRVRGPHTCRTFRCLSCLDAIESIRHNLAKELGQEATAQPAHGEVAFFRLGDEDGAVHSEPPVTEDRIFVNVVPGTEDELTRLMGRWGLGFPRAWCFGVPAAFENGLVGDVITKDGSMMPLQRHRNGVYRKAVFEAVGPQEAPQATSMSLNLGERYSEWLEEKGFLFAKVFGLGQKDQGGESGKIQLQ